MKLFKREKLHAMVEKSRTVRVSTHAAEDVGKFFLLRQHKTETDTKVFC